jgi:hypothetical protein
MITPSYVQFHPLAYLVKLHIEMNMADLIIKVVKASNGNGYDYSGSKSGSTQPKQKSAANKLGKGHIPSAMFVGGNLTFVQAGADDDDIEMNRMDQGGIQKTTRTEVEVVVKQTRQSDSDDRDMPSDAESMRPLRKGNVYTV